MRTTIRRLLALTIAGVSSAAFAQGENNEYYFSIDRLPIADALNVLSQQSGLQVSYFMQDHKRDVVVGPLAGQFTAKEAIARLLSQTGLSFEQPNGRTLVVQPSRSVEAARPAYGEGAYTFLRAAGFSDAESSSVLAQRAGGAGGPVTEADVTEVVVTAQRIEQNLEDVPISIAVLGGDELDSSTLNVSDQIARVPGMAGADTIYGGRQLTVRGVSATAPQFGGTSTVGYYLDTVPFGFVRQSYTPDSSAYDLERVEVLRGPQGTLYGVSAVNGVVRVLTKDPDLDEFELKLRAANSNIKGGGDGYRGDGALNVPLMPGQLAARAVVGYEDNPGWVDGPRGKDINDGTIFNARLKLKAALGEKITVSAMAWHSESDLDGRPLSGRDRQTVLAIDEPTEIDYDVYALNLLYDFASFTLSSSTSSIDYDLYSLSSATIGGTLPVLSNFTSSIFSQEVNLNSTSSGLWRWSLGGIYRDVKDLIFQNIPGAFVNPGGIRYYDYSESFAVFGELTRTFLDGKFEVTAGLRYFEDHNKVKQKSNPFSTTAPLINDGAEFDRVSPRVVFSWHASDDTTLYASYGEGFRSGFTQSPTVLGASPGFPAVGPDNLTNYEVGAKGNLFGGLVSFDAATFFLEWEGVQQSVRVPIAGPAGSIAALINGESASGVGAELSLTLRPATGFELGASYSWNALEFDADVITLFSGSSVVLAPEGARLQNSPERTASVFADYRFPIGSLEGSISASASYFSERVQRAIVAAGSPVLVNSSDSPRIMRASLGLSSSDRVWVASLFVDNLTDFKGVYSPLPDPTLANLATDTQFRARPRTFGLQLEFKM